MLAKRYDKVPGLSDRHVHDVLVGAEHLVPDIQGELEAKRRYLLVDHHFADVVFHAHFIGLDQLRGLVLRRSDLVDGVGDPVTKPFRGLLLCFQSFLGALQHLRVRGAETASNGSDGAHLTLPFSYHLDLFSLGLRRALAEGVDHCSLRSFADRLERIVYKNVGGGDDPVLGKDKRPL